MTENRSIEDFNCNGISEVNGLIFIFVYQDKRSKVRAAFYQFFEIIRRTMKISWVQILFLGKLGPYFGSHWNTVCKISVSLSLAFDKISRGTTRRRKV